MSTQIALPFSSAVLLLNKATGKLQEVLKEDRDFITTLSKGIAKHDKNRHQVFHHDDRRVYPLYACLDDRGCNGLYEPLLICLSVTEEFLINPKPSDAVFGLFRRFSEGNPNDYILPSGGMKSIPCR